MCGVDIPEMPVPFTGATFDKSLVSSQNAGLYDLKVRGKTDIVYYPFCPLNTPLVSPKYMPIALGNSSLRFLCIWVMSMLSQKRSRKRVRTLPSTGVH
jgi:hypothetical protein